MLGDDSVNWHKAVSAYYRKLLGYLGVRLAESKSFHEKGLAEFAKAYYRDGVDLKPISPNLFLTDHREGSANVLTIANALVSKKFDLNVIRTYLILAFPRQVSNSLVTLMVVKGLGCIWGLE